MKMGCLGLYGRLLVLLVLTLLGLEASAAERRSNGKINPGFCKDKYMGYYKHPTDCSKYIICIRNTIPMIRNCPSGSYWDQDEVECNNKQPVNCVNEPIIDNPNIFKRPTVNNNNNNNKINSRVNNGENKCGRIVCYFTRWRQYRETGAHRLFFNDVDDSKCTHIMYPHGNKWYDFTLYRQIKAKKLANPNLKILLTVGGWNMEYFTKMARTSETRKKFVRRTILFLRMYYFDGLDLDWEFPGDIGTRNSKYVHNPPEDKQRFSSLLRELRAAFDEEGSSSSKPTLLLTAAVAAATKTINKAYEIPMLNKYLDFINLMSYNFHGSWDKRTGHNSPLYPENDGDMSNVHSAAKHWVENGASKDKLVIGMPMYGRTFTLNSPSNAAVGASAPKAGVKGEYTKQAGFLAYYEVCQLLKKPGVSKQRITQQKVPYLVDGNQWVGYDDIESIATKVEFVRTKGYGGVMAWDVSLDDMKGKFCGQGKYPLLTTINDVCRADLKY